MALNKESTPGCNVQFSVGEELAGAQWQQEGLQSCRAGAGASDHHTQHRPHSTTAIIVWSD